MRAAIYARISRDATGEALGVTRQIEDCHALVERMGWVVHEVYTDNDISATSGKPRPEYRRMLGDIEAGKVGAVVAWHVDRLYRKLADLEDLIAVVEGNDVAVRTVQAGDFDLATATGRGIARILGSIATMEGEQKSERWRRSWRQRRDIGRWTPQARRTFGYTFDGQVIDAEAERIRKVARDMLQGKSARTILAELNAEGWETTRGGPWTRTPLRSLLKNPRIAGYATYRGEIVGEGDWTPILDRDTWQTLRALLDGRTQPTRLRRYLLTGLIVCGKCGTPLETNKGSTGRMSYRCPPTTSGGCGGVLCIADRVEEVVEAFAQERLSDKRVRQRLAELRSGGQGHLFAEIEALQARLAEIESQLAEPGKSVTALLKASDTLRARIDELQGRLVLTATPIPTSDVDEWPEDLGSRRRLVELVVERVHLDPALKMGRVFDPRRVRIDPR